MKKYYFLIILALILGLVLTGCSLLSNVGQVPASEQSEIAYLTKGGSTEDEASEVKLLASQNIEVGVVKVWNDTENLYVKYAVDAPWCLSETHVHVGVSLTDFPLAGKQKNPIPGQFDYSESHDCVTEYTYVIPLSPWDFGKVFIAAHAVVEKGYCNQIGDVYGIERTFGKVWGVNVLTGETAEIFTTVTPPTGSAKPNGLAYDGENRRFYYCDYQPTTTLYFWDGTQELVAGTLPGEIAAADFDDGKYYFITGPPYSDNLYEVTFDANGYIASITKLADIADNEHGWNFSGDIAVKDGIVYGWGLCGKSGHGWEFFTYDLSTLGTFATVTKTAYQNSLQLAFGLDEELYGHRSGGTGEFFVINTTTGAVGSAVCNTNNILFTDCASGAICEPIIETAWAYGERFTKKGNWATYFTYTVQIDELVLWLDAGKGITEPVDGGLVSEWKDQSVNGNNAVQLNSSHQPTYVTNALNGYPVVSFTGGTEQYLCHTSIPTNDYTAFYVLKLSESGTNKLYYYHAGSVVDGDLGFFAECENQKEGWGSVGNVGNTITVRTSELYPTPLDWRIQTHQPEALYKDGVEVVYARDDNVYAGGLTDIGSRSDHTGLYFVGDIAEILVYGRILDVSEREMVENYLKAKYF